VGNPVFIRVESSDGAVGVSQVRPPTPWLGETTASIMSCIQHYYGPALIGADVSEREALVQRLDRILPGNSVALAALDIAIHDLLGRTWGLPIYRLLGGTHTTVPMDWSVSLNPRAQIVEESLRAVRDHGVRSLCLKIGPSERWREDVDVFCAVREAVGDDIEIAVDPNEGYDLATMLRFLRTLGDESVAYLEQPLPRHALDDLAALRTQAGAPVFIDETAIGLPEAYRAMRHCACDGIVLKLWKTGGYSNTKKMAALAEAAGVRTTLGGVAHGSVIEAAACAHLYAAFGTPPLAAQFVLGMNVIDVDPIVPLPQDFWVRDGVASVPEGPGLGVEPDMAAARDIALARALVE
jgi:L-alanine-DL-glutamate epimerase-like enolase superfamily enzyme